MGRAQTLPKAARNHYAQQKALAQGAKNRAADLWKQVDPGDISGSWESVGRAVAEDVTQRQARAAALADPYIDATAPKNGRAARGVVNARTFAGVASDGRDLDSLLLSPVVRAKREIGQGRSVSEALEVGGRTLGRIVVTQTLDAGRDAVQAGMVARPWVTGYVRVLSLPACGRCAVLAGTFYLFNEGFERHPRCDCQHLPADKVDASDLTVNARDYFDVLTPEEQDKFFTKAGAEAIRLGADPAQVVNARRKGAVYVAGTREFTREGVVRKRKGKTRALRITPAQILREAGDDRDEAVRLLKLHRYLI